MTPTTQYGFLASNPTVTSSPVLGAFFTKKKIVFPEHAEMSVPICGNEKSKHLILTFGCDMKALDQDSPGLGSSYLNFQG